jgi:hypothetical protein
VRKQRVGLKHHADVAVGRGAQGHVLAADQDLPGRRHLQPCDETQRRGLAAAGGAEQRHQRAGIDGEGEAVDGAHRAVLLHDRAKQNGRRRGAIHR